MNNPLNSLVRQILGKGEVVSSILPGSTTKPHELRASDNLSPSRSATYDGTTQERAVSVCGKSVDFVHRAFRRWLKQQKQSGASPEIETAATRVLLGLIAVEKNRTTSPAIINGLAEDVAALERALAPIMRRHRGI